MKKEPTRLSESREDYLETISHLCKQNGVARLVDIARIHKVSRASVSNVLSILRKSGYIDYEKYKPVVLTKEGKAIAKSVFSKHEVLLSFLTDILGVNSDEADSVACKMEHSLNENVFSKLSDFVKNFPKKNRVKSK